MAQQKTITSANTVFTLAIAGIIPAPVQLQGFTADDVFDIERIAVGQSTMGIDGKLSAGFVFSEVPQSITLQADSDSNDLFEEWYRQEKLNKDKFFAKGMVMFPSLGMGYVLTKGALIEYQPASNPKKTMSPRTFLIHWESVDGANA